uniref:Uncharacterized protein n=1 Tax=Physcomitrium patens TaxID=3218 RepID=A0A2K1KC78_PHYPA|nr:hypothetical protein PHYPA_010569 [Physcomitrium patens]
MFRHLHSSITHSKHCVLSHTRTVILVRQMLTYPLPRTPEKLQKTAGLKQEFILRAIQS